MHRVVLTDSQGVIYTSGQMTAEDALNYAAAKEKRGVYAKIEVVPPLPAHKAATAVERGVKKIKNKLKSLVNG